jgi:hypothetical protein
MRRINTDYPRLSIASAKIRDYFCSNLSCFDLVLLHYYFYYFYYFYYYYYYCNGYAYRPDVALLTQLHSKCTNL